MTKSIVKGSLSDVAAQNQTSIAESFVSADAILIVDTSGSMQTRDAPNNQSRHEAAESELRALQRQLPGKIAVISFSNDVMFCPSGIPHRFDSGTDMARALQFVKPADGLGIKFILISDGLPNSESKTLEIARGFKSKIDTVFIGAEDGYAAESGREFLAKLAKASGGQSLASAEPAMLKESVEQLLLTG